MFLQQGSKTEKQMNSNSTKYTCYYFDCPQWHHKALVKNRRGRDSYSIYLIMSTKHLISLYSYQRQDVAGFSRQVPRQHRLLVADGPEKLVLVASAERRLAQQHFV